MAAILQLRASAEERFARELAAIAGRPSLSEQQRQSEGSLGAAWAELRASHAARAEAHAALAKKIQTEMVKASQKMGGARLCMCVLCCALFVFSFVFVFVSLFVTSAPCLKPPSSPKVLNDDIRDRSTKKGELFEEDKSLHARLEKHKSATEAALQRFLTASAAAEASRKQFHFAQQDASIPPKKLK